MGPYQTGFEDSAIGTRATVGGTLHLTHQGVKMFRPHEKGVADSFSRVGMIVLFQLIRHKDRFIRNDLDRFDKETAGFITDVLTMDPDMVPTRFSLRVETTEAEKTEEAKRQQTLMLTQLYTVFGEKLLQLSQMIAQASIQAKQDPAMQAVLEPAMKIYTGACRLMEKTMVNFDIDDPDKYVPDYSKLEQLQQMLFGFGGINGQGTSNGPDMATRGGGPGVPLRTTGVGGGMEGAQPAPIGPPPGL